MNQISFITLFVDKLFLYFILMGVDYICRYRNILSKQNIKSLITYLFYIGIPALMFLAVVQNQFFEVRTTIIFSICLLHSRYFTLCSGGWNQIISYTR